MSKFAIATALMLSSSVLSFQLTTTPLNKRSFLVQGNRQRNTMLAEHLNILQDHSLLVSSLDAVQHALSSAMQQQQHIDMQSLHTSFNLADGDVIAVPDAVDAVATASSGLYKVDKSGFIGFFADLFEQAIDILHDVAKKTGAESTYGLAIVFFTFLSKSPSSSIIRVFLTLNGCGVRKSCNCLLISQFHHISVLNVPPSICVSFFVYSQSRHLTADCDAIGINHQDAKADTIATEDPSQIPGQRR